MRIHADELKTWGYVDWLAFTFHHTKQGTKELAYRAARTLFDHFCAIGGLVLMISLGWILVLWAALDSKRSFERQIANGKFDFYITYD